MGTLSFAPQPASASPSGSAWSSSRCSRVPAPQQESALSPEQAKQRRRAAVRAFHKQLATDYPAVVFAPEDRAPPVALMVGIGGRIAARYRGVPVRTRAAFFHRYTRCVPYLRLLTEGTDRIGLDGEAAGGVTATEAQRAAERLDALRSRSDGSGTK